MIQTTYKEFYEIAMTARGWVKKVYWHWSAGWENNYSNDYHINIDGDSTNGALMLPSKNLAVKRNHTYYRNSNALGITLLGGARSYFSQDPATYGLMAFPYGMSAEDIDDSKIDQIQIERCAQISAILADVLEIPVDIQHFMTHAEAANNLDGYNPGYDDPTGYPNNIYGPPLVDENLKRIGGGNCERWDLYKLIDTDGKIKDGGQVLRGKTKFYLDDIANINSWA